MSAKEIVQEFYKSDALLENERVAKLLHDDVVLEWHSSKGFLKLKRQEIIDLTTEFAKAYVAPLQGGTDHPKKIQHLHETQQ